MRSSKPPVFLLAAALAACAGPPPEDSPLPLAQETFWSALQELCGQAFQGVLTEASPQDSAVVDLTLLMHVRQCAEDEISIPFHVGDDRSRTWIISRTETGLRLKHDHRHEDGSEDPITRYGGDAAGPGAPERQEFPADSFTAELLPEAATNVWTIEVSPGRSFVYALRREGTDRRFRVEFDLTRPVPPPPTPWGY